MQHSGRDRGGLLLARIESRRVLNMFGALARRAAALGTASHSSGRGELPEVKALDRIMGLITAFDGCAYGLRDWSNEPVKKPWHVITKDRRAADSVYRKCPGGHQHAPCRGRTAVASAADMPAIARHVARARCQGL